MMISLILILAISGGAMSDMTTTRARLSQVALTVTDIDVARGFYEEKLRLPVRYAMPTMLVFELDGGATLMLSLPEGEVGHSADGAVVYLEVEDIHGTREAMRNRGVEFVDEPHVVHRTDEMELWMTFLRDPDGHLLAITSIGSSARTRSRERRGEKNNGANS